MADDIKDTGKDQGNEETAPQQTKQEEPKDKGNATNANSVKTFTQEEVNKMVGDARLKERKKAASKYEDYEELKKFKEQAEPQIEELQVLQAKEAKREMKKEVSNETGLDYETVSLLAGDTKEELMANAEKHKEKYGVPKEPSGNHGTPKKEESARDKFAAKINAALDS